MDKYLTLEEVGNGAFGHVYKVKENSTGKMFVKKMTPVEPTMQKYIEEEMRVHSIFRKEKPSYINYAIEEFYEIKKETNKDGKVVDKKYSVLILPFCNSGDLNKYVTCRKLLTEDEANKISIKLLTGLQFCHSYKIMHRDLKLQNVLLHKEDQESELQVFLCDFGLSKTTDFGVTVLGSCAFMAPEILLHIDKSGSRPHYDNRVDIWSLGVMVYKMLLGEVFLMKMDEVTEFLKEKKIKFTKNRRLSLCALSFLECCLQFDPSNRKTLPELMEHEFVTCSSVPWYYYDWISSDSPAQVIDTTSFEYTHKMEKKKKEMLTMFEGNVVLSSLSAYYQNK